MRRSLLAIAALSIVASLAVGLGAASAAARAGGGAATVGTTSTSLGRVLVDARGHTLYLFAKDKHGKSACSGQCTGFWPPLITAGKPHAAKGAKASLLGTTRRSDGRLQVTYNRHPVYTFVKDTRKGQTSGEEVDAFGAEWYAVSPAGAKVEKGDAAASTTGNTTSGGNGYSGGSGYSGGAGYGY